MRQSPGLAASLVEHVVDLQPWRFDDFFIDLRRHTRCHHLGLQRSVELDPADTGRQPLRQRTQTSADVTQPVVQVVGAGIEQRAFLVRIGQARLIAAQGIDAFLVLGLTGRQHPALVVEVETRLGLGQVGVFGGLRLRTGEVFTQCPAQVANLHQHAIFPARHVVHPQTWRESVVGNIAARLGQQGAGDGLEGFHRGVADDHLLAFFLGRQLRGLLDRKQCRLLAPVPAQDTRHQQVDAQQSGQRPAEQQTAQITAGLRLRFSGTFRRTACAVLPVQHGDFLSSS
ncbi:hypothetical protein D3C87_1290360 [compost metagenome]